MAKFRYGVVKRSPPERRTFLGVVWDSLLERKRAEELALQEPVGLIWEPHPTFTLGCPENRYTADFRVWTPDIPWFDYTVLNRKGELIRKSVPVPDGWVEETKSVVRTGIGRLVRLWKAYGSVPLVILTEDKKTRGWIRRVVIPKGKA